MSTACDLDVWGDFPAAHNGATHLRASLGALGPLRQVAVGETAALVVTDAGGVFQVGNVSAKSAWNSDVQELPLPTPVSQGLQGVHIEQVCVGDGFAAARSSVGSVYTW